MAFNIKTAKINEDGSLTDGTNTITENDKGYHLLKARINAGGSFTRVKKTKEQLKEELGRRTVGTFRWFKITMQLQGYDIDKSGYKAIMKAISEGKFSMEKAIETLKEYNNKTITEAIVDISLGKKTEKTEKRLALLKAKEERKKQISENKQKKIAEKIAKQEKAIADRKARDEKKIAEKQAKLQLDIAKMEAKSKELEKERAKL